MKGSTHVYDSVAFKKHATVPKVVGGFITASCFITSTICMFVTSDSVVIFYDVGVGKMKGSINL